MWWLLLFAPVFGILLGVVSAWVLRPRCRPNYARIARLERELGFAASLPGGDPVALSVAPGARWLVVDPCDVYELSRRGLYGSAVAAQHRATVDFKRQLESFGL